MHAVDIYGRSRDHGPRRLLGDAFETKDGLHILGGSFLSRVINPETRPSP